ncbi:hypothetical protein AAC387_Pa04g2526 [Persea americana]
MAHKSLASWLLLLFISLGLFSIFSEAADKQQHRNKQSSSSSSSSSIDSSAVFSVQGNVYPDGLFYVTLYIGNPPKPYYLDVDTGSDLTWVQCDAPCRNCFPGPHQLYRPKKNKLVYCEDPLCTSIHTLRKHTCGSPHEQCDYLIAYADQGSSLGVLVKDAFSLQFANGSLLQPHLAFGCGYDQQVPSINSPAPTDGVLGLGYGKSSIISQLQDLGLTRNVIGHCFSGRGGGYLFFGDSLVPYSSVTWTPMFRSPSLKYYSPGPANLLFGNQPMGLKGLPVVFDSGSSYTYFATRAYEAFIYAVKKYLPAKQLKEAPEDKTLPLCWKGTRRFKSILDVKKFFKPLVLIFAKGKKAQLEIPPEGYLIITSKGTVCLGILNGTEAGLGNLNVIGDISMQDLMVIYDNDKQQIGWVHADCNRLPNADGGGDGFGNSFTQPYVASMGILTDDL